MFKEFIDAAKNEIEAINEKDSDLQQEEDRIRNRLNEIAEIRSKPVIKDDALQSYITACTSNLYTCPSCFISQNSIIEMRPIGSDNKNNVDIDIFKCPHCSSIIEVENIS
jgi:hypothetical protein